MNFKYPLILASSSPRRQYLMRELGYSFSVENPTGDERYPADLPVWQVARYLATKKAESFRSSLKNEVVITADTVVILDETILNKPTNRPEALEMLHRLSGRTHHVMTGVCILSAEKELSFDDTTEVTFTRLTAEEISYYVDVYRPFDKAGAYGAQDFIGMIGIEKISGSYFNVMGLPVHKVYQALKHW
jgi:septum formation protein